MKFTLKLASLAHGGNFMYFLVNLILFVNLPLPWDFDLLGLNNTQRKCYNNQEFSF